MNPNKDRTNTHAQACTPPNRRASGAQSTPPARRQLTPARQAIMSRTALAAHAPAEAHFYTCRYTWTKPGFGELDGEAVIIGTDADAALRHFRSANPQVTCASIVNRPE